MAVVTELVIDGSGATRGAEEYSRAMDKAQASMQRGMGAMATDTAKLRDQVTGLIPGLNLVVIGVVALTAAAVAGLDVIVRWNRGIADMGDAARKANIDIERFQQLRFAAFANGISNDTFAKGAESLADNLRKASHEENDLSKLLDQNKVKFKDGNTLLLDTDKLLEVARDLIFRAGDSFSKIKMAEMLGLTKEWVPLLDKPKEAFEATQKEASALGLVIGRETVARAEEFDREWKKAGEVFSVWIKSKLSELLPFIDDLISGASHLKDVVAEAVNAAAGPDAAQAAARLAVVSQLFHEALNAGDLDDAAKIAAQSLKLLAGTLDVATLAAIDERIAVNNLDKAWEDFGKRYAAVQATVAQSNVIPFPRPNPLSRADRTASSLPPADEKDGGRDFFDRAVDSIDKHIARLAADNLAVGQNVGVQQQLRAEFALLEAAKQSDLDVTTEQIAAYTKFRATMTAENALKAAGIELEDEQAAAFKRTTEGIRQQALATDLLKRIHDGASTALAGFSKDIANGVAPMTALANQAKRFAESIIDVASKRIATDIFGSVLGGASQTASATEASGILTTAGTTLAASMVAGATEAAGILGTTVPTAAATLPVAGAVTGGEIATGGGIAAGLLTAAGTVLWGPLGILIAAIAAVAAIVGISGNSAEKDRQKKAIQGYRDRAVLAGTDTSTLQGQLTEFDIRARAEQAALPNGGLTQKSWTNTLTLGLFGDKGGKPTQELIELQKAQEAERLKVIQDYNAKIVDAEKKAEADRLAVIEDFGRAMNEVKGQGFLNDFSDLFKQIAAYQSAGVGPGQLAEFFGLSAQKIVDDADLTGAAFNNLLDIFPQLTGVIHESTKAIDDQIEAERQRKEELNSAAKNILDFIRERLAGPQSTLSPQDRLTNAQAAYNAQLALAQSGNVEAQANITKYADDLLKAGRDVFASSQQYQDLQQQIIAQLLALPAITQSDDPLIQAMRDVLGAINDGNGTQALDATLKGTLVTALTTGNIAAFVATLGKNETFKSIDTNTNNAIDFDELVKGLGPQGAQIATELTAAGLLTDGQLRLSALGVSGPLTDEQIKDLGLSKETGNLLKVWTTLDADGNGQISRDELLRGKVAYVGDSVGSLDNTTDKKLNQTNANTAAANTLLVSTNQILEFIHTGTDRLRDLVSLTDPMRTNSRVIADNTQYARIAGPGGQLTAGGSGVATGGWIHGPGSGTSDTAGMFRLSNGEFVVNAASAAANRSLLESINDNRAPISNVVAFPVHGGGDSGAVVSELRRLYARIESLERTVAGSNARVAQAVSDAGEGVEGAVADGMGKVAFETRQAARKNAA